MIRSSFLQKIHDLTQTRVSLRKRVFSFEEVKRKALHMGPSEKRFEHSFVNHQGTRIISEIKKMSPSLGVINQAVVPGSLASGYQHAGAMAVSVLTEPDYFGGSIENLIEVRKKNPSFAILQKDFVVDPYQIYEARLIGADCILLIVAMLSNKDLNDFYLIATELGLSCLVEVHTMEELETALELGARIIGVNNRDLHTLQISLEVSRKLASSIPKDVLSVSESGITKAEEIRELKSLGYKAFLIGSSLMHSHDPAHSLKILLEESAGES